MLCPINRHIMRKIIHIDMDAFFAAVEQLDNPSLRGRPVIVGGPPDSRGVVSTCSYEARRFGVRSAMPSSRAYRLCPHAVFLPGRFDRYIDISQRVRSIMGDYTDQIEPLSLDEAYLDVTDYLGGRPATEVAEEIRRRIKDEIRLTASAGVSYNMFLAKVASDFRKPDGLTVVTPRRAQSFIEALPVGRFYGVGKVTEARMKEMGLLNGADLKRAGLDALVSSFGKSGAFYYSLACGNDPREVEPSHERKSFGRERTFGEDILDVRVIREVLRGLAGSVSRRLKGAGASGKTVTLKLKYDDFTSVTRSRTLPLYVDSEDVIYSVCSELVEKTDAGSRKVRLVGASVANICGEDDGADFDRQLTFDFGSPWTYHNTML